MREVYSPVSLTQVNAAFLQKNVGPWASSTLVVEKNTITMPIGLVPPDAVGACDGKPPFLLRLRYSDEPSTTVIGNFFSKSSAN
jgi:hypothetical protein